MASLTISCDDCTMTGTSACEGCVVSFLCDRDPGDAIVIDVDEARAVRLLGRAGLVPPLRHRARRPVGSRDGTAADPWSPASGVTEGRIGAC